MMKPDPRGVASIAFGYRADSKRKPGQRREAICILPFSVKAGHPPPSAECRRHDVAARRGPLRDVARDPGTR